MTRILILILLLGILFAIYWYNDKILDDDPIELIVMNNNMDHVRDQSNEKNVGQMIHALPGHARFIHLLVHPIHTTGFTQRRSSAFDNPTMMNSYNIFSGVTRTAIPPQTHTNRMFVAKAQK